MIQSLSILHIKALIILQEHILFLKKNFLELKWYIIFSSHEIELNSASMRYRNMEPRESFSSFFSLWGPEIDIIWHKRKRVKIPSNGAAIIMLSQQNRLLPTPICSTTLSKTPIPAWDPRPGPAPGPRTVWEAPHDACGGLLRDPRPRSGENTPFSSPEAFTI